MTLLARFKLIFPLYSSSKRSYDSFTVEQWMKVWTQGFVVFNIWPNNVASSINRWGPFVKSPFFPLTIRRILMVFPH